jgi:anti-anti-sigma factor
MEITKEQLSGDEAHIKVRGRLDAYWSDHLDKELEPLIREGTHRLWLDMAEVTYLSSLGIGLLVRLQKQLRALGGTLKVINPSRPVKEVLDVTKLLPLLVADPGDALQKTWQFRAPKRGAAVERDGVVYESFDYPDAAALKCRTIGNPTLLSGCRFREPDCRELSLGADLFAIGVGALGQGFQDCQSRFGEFLAAGSVAAYLPTDGTNVPDYLMLAGGPTSNVRLCYGLALEGKFSRLVRFEAQGESSATLTDLVTRAQEFCAADTIGMVLVADSAGLLGVALQRSPAQDARPDAPFAHPQIREWLSFTGEHAYRHSTTLVVGVASKGDGGKIGPFVRPLGPAGEPLGHFHAAPFTHRTMQKGEIDLQQTVMSLFEGHHLQSILHLLGDYRPASGLGESEFVRGACWMGPVGEVVAEGGAT